MLLVQMFQALKATSRSFVNRPKFLRNIWFQLYETFCSGLDRATPFCLFFAIQYIIQAKEQYKMTLF